MKWRDVLFLGGIGAVWFVFFAMHAAKPWLVDEKIHVVQIRWFANGKYDLDPILLMLPTYHAIVAAIVRVIGNDSLIVIRLITACGFLAGIAIFFRLVGFLDTPQRFVRTAQFAFFPLFYPFCFLAYTDLWSLALLLAAVLAALHRRPVICALLILAAMAVRSMLAVWLPLLLWLLMEDSLPVSWSQAWCRRMWQRTWPLLVVAVAAVGFIAWNGGVTPTGMDSKILAVNWTSVWLLFFVFAFLFLPQGVVGWLDLFRSRGLKGVAVALVVCVALMVLFWSAFKIRHYFNWADASYYLHNILLRTMNESRLLRALVMLPVGLGLLALVTGLPSRPFGLRWVPPLAVLSLLPMAMVEPRYLMPGATLFLAFRKPQSVEMEWTVMLAYAAASVWLTLGSFSGSYFP